MELSPASYTSEQTEMVDGKIKKSSVIDEQFVKTTFLTPHFTIFKNLTQKSVRILNASCGNLHSVSSRFECMSVVLASSIVPHVSSRFSWLLGDS
jgi:hypothetical protein